MLKDQRRAGAAGAARCWRPPAAPTAAGPEPSSFRLRSVNTNSTQDSLDRGPDAQPVRRPRARPRAEDHPSAGHVVELHHPLRHVERMVIGQRHDLGGELDALRIVNILTGQAEVRPELALAILERKFPQRWAKVTVVAAPPHHLTFNVADILQKVQERIAQGRAQGQLPRATIINAAGNTTRPHDPRPPRLALVSDLPGDGETKPI